MDLSNGSSRPSTAPTGGNSQGFNSKPGLIYGLLALLVSGVACGLWSIPSKCILLTDISRPNAALSSLLGALAVIAKLTVPRGVVGRALVLISCTTMLSLGVSVLMGHWVRLWPIPDGFFASMACSEHWVMAPVTAVVVIATSVALLMVRCGAEGARQAVGISLSLAVIVACGGFAIEAVYQFLEPRPTLATAQVAPLTAIALLLVNVAALYAHSADGFMGEFLGPQEGSRNARRLLMGWTVVMLALGAGWARLQHKGMITPTQSAALLVASGFTLFAAVACDRAKRLNKMYRKQQNAVRSLEKSLQQCTELSEHLAQEQRRLASVLRAAELYSIIEIDPQGLVATFNHGAELLLGYRAVEVVGHCTPEAWHDPEELAERARTLGVTRVLDVFSLLPKSGICDSRPWTFIRKDGRRVPVMLSITAAHDDDGRLTGYVAIARDITADRRAQRDICGFLSVGQELLCRISFQGVIERTSPSLKRILGYGESELVTLPYLNLVHPHDVVPSRNAFAVIGEGVAIERFENRWRGKDGQYRWISWSFINGGDAVYAGGWDITQDKNRERERQRRLEFEQQLIGIVSHDLRNPIAIIALSAECIQQEPDATQMVETAAYRILNATTRAAGLIHDLLDFTQARLGSGIPIRLTDVNVAEITRQAVEEIRLKHPDRRLVVEVPQKNSTIKADSGRLSQVVTNLLSNSIKHGKGDVTARLCRMDRDFVLEVHNDGLPIASHLLPHLFEPLQRGGAANDQKQHSFGLGLYIVREIVRAHGGSIAVKSSTESGTTFRVVLPQNRLDADVATGVSRTQT